MNDEMKVRLDIIISEFEKSQKNIPPIWVGEGWYKSVPNSFNYFASGFEAGIEFSKQQIIPKAPQSRPAETRLSDERDK
jgi:hypothetical protein